MNLRQQLQDALGADYQIIRELGGGHEAHGRMDPDALHIPYVHERLGELYEAKGKRGDALRHRNVLRELCKNADPALRARAG